MRERNTISPGDMDLFLVTDDVNEAITLIRNSISKFGLRHENGLRRSKWLFEKNSIGAQ